MGFFGDLFGEEKEIKQEPMLTKEQKQAMTALRDFMNTGRIGPYQAGAAYGGDLGAYQPTETEQIGQNKLRGLLEGGLPQVFESGVGEINDLLSTTKYDPFDEKGVYSGFKTNVLRELGESQDRLSQRQATQGNLYSTDTAEQRGLLEERGQQALTNKLAQLYDQFAGRRLQAAGTAADLGMAEQGLMGDQINMASSIGALGRLLEDQQAKEAYADWQRRHQERAQTLNAAQTVFKKQVPYGVKSYSYTEPSPWGNLLDSGLELAGTAAGYAMGGPVGGQIGGTISNNLLGDGSAGTSGFSSLFKFGNSGLDTSYLTRQMGRQGSLNNMAMPRSVLLG